MLETYSVLFKTSMNIMNTNTDIALHGISITVGGGGI